MTRFTFRALLPAALLALGALSLSACDSTESCDSESGGASCLPVADFAVVVNQGNFTEANGTLGRFDRSGTAGADSTASLGSLLQSAAYSPSDGRLYVTANTAGRLDVFTSDDALGLQRVAQIAVESPRYVAFVSATKAYVTTQLYDRPSVVTVVNPQTGAATGTVEVGGFAEGVAVAGGRAYVATGAFSASTEVVVLNTGTDAVVDRIDVGCAPRLVLTDAGLVSASPDVFVVCSGADADEVVVLDAATGAVERRLAVGGTVSTAGPGQDADVALVGGAVVLFVARADGTVAYFSADGGAVTTITVGGTDPIGAVAYEPDRGELYVTRVPGFSVGGYVTVHSLGGTEVTRFSSGGIAPSQVVFRTRIEE